MSETLRTENFRKERGSLAALNVQPKPDAGTCESAMDNNVSSLKSGFGKKRPARVYKILKAKLTADEALEIAQNADTTAKIAIAIASLSAIVSILIALFK